MQYVIDVNIHYVSFSPRPGDDLADSQQPGSPGCPQQFRLFRILVKLLRNTRYIFLFKGIETDMLVRKSLTFGILFAPYIILLNITFI